MGQAYAMGQLAAFTRVQESTADQIAAKLLLATHQSPMGMYQTFQRFADEERGAPTRSTSSRWTTHPARTVYST